MGGKITGDTIFMKTINVSLKENAYKIVIGRGILPRLGAKLKSLKIGMDAVVITSPCDPAASRQRFGRGFKKEGFFVKFFEVPEGNKANPPKWRSH